MKYEITYNQESRILYIRLFGILKAEDMEPVSHALEEAIGDGDTVGSIIDMNKMRGIPMMSREVREKLADMNEHYPRLRRSALIGVPPAARVVAKAVMNLAKGSKKVMEYRFFKTEAEALDWLKGE